MSRSRRSPRQKLLQARLQEARKVGGLTQGEVPDRLNRPQSFVSKYESREPRLDLVELIEVADVLQLDLFHLVENLRAISRTRHGRQLTLPAVAG